MNCTGTGMGGAVKRGKGRRSRKGETRGLKKETKIMLLSKPEVVPEPASCQLFLLSQLPSSHEVHVNSNYPHPHPTLPNILTQLAEMGHYTSSDFCENVPRKEEKGSFNLQNSGPRLGLCLQGTPLSPRIHSLLTGYLFSFLSSSLFPSPSLSSLVF